MRIENAKTYDWYTPRAMRQILEPVRGIPIPRPTLTYWRNVLNMRPSKDPLTKGLYSHDDLCILAGAIVWLQSERPLSVYASLIDQGYRLQDVIPDISERLKLINILEVKKYAN